jgi:hypothetical protein
MTWTTRWWTGALDLLLGSEKGNCAVDPQLMSGLEAVYLLELRRTFAPHVDRFCRLRPLSCSGR